VAWALDQEEGGVVQLETSQLTLPPKEAAALKIALVGVTAVLANTVASETEEGAEVGMPQPTFVSEDGEDTALDRLPQLDTAVAAVATLALPGLSLFLADPIFT
jgi:hypothetical protein